MMSNRDGRKAKRNKKKKVSHANKICPRCQSSLDKCGEHDHKGHGHHRICKTCHWCNF